MWTHTNCPILFSLVVDNFGIKTVGKQHANHLLAALCDLYAITINWTGSKYLGLTLKWDYINRTCNVSMPGYIEAALHRFQHPEPDRPQHSPHQWLAPNYSATIQLTPLNDTTPPLNPAGLTHLQQVIGIFLFYGRIVDSTMLVALGTLASSQTNGTEATAQALSHLLNYTTTHPDAVIRHHASDVILYIHSDASYLSEPKAKSHVGGHFFLSSCSDDPTKPPTGQPPSNGAVYTISNIFRNVMSSATEAKFAGLFHNTKYGAMLRTTLAKMGHTQPPTPIQTDNSTATGITNGTVRQCKFKALDMRFCWIQDCVRQGHFLVYWRRGKDNMGDYFTKHHATAHHQQIQPTYLHVAQCAIAPCASDSKAIRLCVNSTFRVPSGSLRVPMKRIRQPLK